MCDRKRSLYSHFEPEFKRDLYRLELEKRVKLDNEDYGGLLSHLTSKVFTILQDKSWEQLTLNYYLNQIRDVQI